MDGEEEARSAQHHKLGSPSGGGWEKWLGEVAGNNLATLNYSRHIHSQSFSTRGTSANTTSKDRTLKTQI